METIERFEPFTAEELEKVKGVKTGSTGCFLVATVLIVLVAGPLILMTTLGSFQPGPVVPALVALVAAGLIFFFFRYTTSEKRKADRDLSGGKKRVLITEVSNQIMESSVGSRRRGSHVYLSYYIEIAGKKYRVTEEEYYKYKKGMPVEVHVTPYAEKLLGIYDANTGQLLKD